jgi:predicted nicotinamide N-methyase
VDVAGLSLSRHWPHPCGSTPIAASQLVQAAASEVLLAGLLVRSSHIFRKLLANAEVLQLAAGPGALAAAAAVRLGARRVLVTHPERASLNALACSLHGNRSKVSRAWRLS